MPWGTGRHRMFRKLNSFLYARSRMTASRRTGRVGEGNGAGGASRGARRVTWRRPPR